MATLDRSGVTTREREVLRLLGDRLTNAEIADLLFISVRTVESHVSSLLMKLGAENRRDLALFKSEALLRGFPVPQTTLIGRADEIAVVEDLVSKSRLVTLTGVGGSGKTRLAIEAGRRLAGRFADGATFTDLAPLRDADLIVVALAQALGIEPGESSLDLEQRQEELLGRVVDLDALVVLDNCEHLLEATAGFVDRLLEQTNGFRVVVTSREAFGIPGESRFVVPPLDLPDGTSHKADSVLLFEDRASHLRPDLDLTSHQDAIEAICRNVDGIPLGIELAAVQVAHLAPEEIAVRLEGHLGLLSGRHVSDPRQATLRDTIEWSYDLMSSDERLLFARLAVFSGWFPLGGVEAVCAEAPLHREQVADLIAGLVWKSMLTADVQGARARYRLLETLRTYAAEKLRESGEFDERLASHCAWCISVAEQAEPHLMKADRDEWLLELDALLPNVRAAFDYAIFGKRSEDASRLFVAVWRYFHMRGDIAEGIRWADDIVAMGDVSAHTRGRLLGAAGGLAYWAGNMERSRTLYEEGLDLVREHGSDGEIADALYNTSFAYGFGGKTEEALVYLDEARTIFEGLGDHEGFAKSLWGWGACAYGGGLLEEARPKLEEALRLYQSIDDLFMRAWAERMLGSTLLKLGETKQALPHLDTGLRLFNDAGDVSGIILHIRDFAQLAVDEGDPERAITLVGALAALQDRSGLDLVEAFSQQIEGLESLVADVEEGQVAALTRTGRELSRDQLIDYATSIQD